MIYIVLVIVFIFIMIILGKYNGLVRKRNMVKQSESTIDVYLKQRFDLIPNLVECVKGYAKHEKELLERVVELRNEYNSNNEVNLKQAADVNTGINKILVLAENYPDLKASEQFLNLQKNLEKMESQIQAARRIYNVNVSNYNTSIQTVPNNIVAKMFGFKEAEFFQMEDSERANINVEFNQTEE